MRVRLFNVKYSPNLGDGLLSECLENALIACGADREGTRSVDLSARTAYAPGDASRSAVLSALDKLPGPVRGAAVRVPLTLLLRRRWRPHYVASLDDADAAVIGGGNLFTDMDLNFPTKLAAALEEIARRDLPVAIYGVGVGETFSSAGKRMVRDALAAARLVDVSVRDEASAERFRRHFGDVVGPARVVRDPGLLAARRLGVAPEPSGAVGICITSALAVRYHSNLSPGDDALANWYCALAEALVAADQKVIAFTNGSPEDEAFVAPLTQRLETIGAARRTVRTPSGLAALIGGMRALVAHRMHALIAGYAFAVPIHALAWDGKVAAFMSSVGLAEPVVAAPGTAEALAQNVVDSLDIRPSPECVVDEADAAVRAMHKALATAQ